MLRTSNTILAVGSRSGTSLEALDGNNKNLKSKLKLFYFIVPIQYIYTNYEFIFVFSRD